MNERMNMFRNRLTKVYRHKSKQARRLGISCYRVYDHDLPEFPFRIELYEDQLYVAEYKRQHGLSDEEHAVWIEQSLLVIGESFQAPNENIHLKLRQRKPGRLGQYQKLESKQNEFLVEENGLKFIVNLTGYIDTGLFLDHRVTRQMIREQSKGKKILNLFSYTGSFSVYAAAGDASEVVTVDLSKTYIDWAGRNMKLNDFDDSHKYRYIQEDVLKYIKDIDKEYFDIIIIDPPTFSNSKRMEGFLDVQRDHLELLNFSIRGLKKSGSIYFSTNSRKFKFEKDKLDTQYVKDITRQTTPFDFERKFSRFCFLIEK